MRNGKNAKLGLSLALAVALALLMSYRPSERRLHEWLGLALIILSLAHNVVHRAWWARSLKNWPKGFRLALAASNVLALLALTAQSVSGIVMSGHVFGFLGITGGQALARQVHLAVGGWAFALAFLHCGLQLSLRWRRPASEMALSRPKPLRRAAALFGAAALAAYGLITFLRSDLWSHMSLSSQFAFIDF
ncbi:MAG: DUF4405 domain-containing protein, partial [Deltaproteobacteria bacterium]|nr:DUF4405 domain-containing protein [Deltaproteobacteria bacterium]